MADREDVRRIALALPDTSEAEDHFAFSVLNKGKQKGFVWAWNERVESKKPRVPRPDVVAGRRVVGVLAQPTGQCLVRERGGQVGEQLGAGRVSHAITAHARTLADRLNDATFPHSALTDQHMQF